MEDWTKKTDEDVFSRVGEEYQSQAWYWRDVEIKRRVFLLQKQLLNAQMEAVAAQQAATKEAAKQSWIMVWSTVGIFLTAVIMLVTHFLRA